MATTGTNEIVGVTLLGISMVFTCIAFGATAYLSAEALAVRNDMQEIDALDAEIKRLQDDQLPTYADQV